MKNRLRIHNCLAKSIYLPISVLMAGFCLAACSWSKDGDECRSALRQLDETLGQRKVYEQYLLDRVSVLISVRSENGDSVQIYNLNRRIAKEFISYSVDSTMKYLGECRKIATGLGDRAMILESDIMIAEEYTLAGYHLEANELLRTIDPGKLPENLVYPYYEAQHNLAKELLLYATDPVIVKRQDSLRTFYRDKLFSYVERGSYEWVRLKIEEAVQAGRTEAAKELASGLVDICEKGSHEYAIACYLYQELLDRNTFDEEKTLWLIRSALTDVMCATKDYASLNELAAELFRNGDIDRSFEYTADYCMPDAIFFGGKLRPWQISQVFPDIGRAYQNKNDRWQKQVNKMIIGMVSLMIILILLMIIIYLRQQVLVKTRKALSASYIEIEHQNSNLLEANRKLSDLNCKIMESDKVKQEYIALFLGILSENISKSRQYNNHILKYIRRGNVKEIESEIESLPPIDDDILEFYKMFDRTFLNLYPGFVDRFNALLCDGESVLPKGDDCLTPELRVFALIKLGISDSSKIASLLHYSANTIYNYRAKIKNKARGDRAAFEDAVRML